MGACFVGLTLCGLLHVRFLEICLISSKLVSLNVSPGFWFWLPSTSGSLRWRGCRENQNTESADGFIECGFVVWVSLSCEVSWGMLDFLQTCPFKCQSGVWILVAIHIRVLGVKRVHRESETWIGSSLKRMWVCCVGLTCMFCFFKCVGFAPNLSILISVWGLHSLCLHVVILFRILRVERVHQESEYWIGLWVQQNAVSLTATQTCHTNFHPGLTFFVVIHFEDFRVHRDVETWIGRWVNTTWFSYCAGLLAIRPRAFLVNLVLCLALILQGTWQFQVAMSLYSERFIPLGCSYKPGGTPGMNGAAMFSSTKCDLQEMIVRAVALMNFAFNCHVIAVVFFSVFIFAVVAKVYGHRRVTYDPISSDFDSEAMQLKSMAATNKLSFERR